MADYRTIAECLASGETNMTVIVNNVKHDDDVVTAATGISWFKYNNVVVSNLYCSGNSWIGIGTNNESYSVKVNRRDCAMYYLYKESGRIGWKNFFHIRWKGFSAYNSTAASYAQQFDLFLFETGQIYLNWYTVPTSNFNGTNAIVCSSTVSFSAVAGTPCDYTFTPASEGGTGWIAEAGFHVQLSHFVPNGSAEFTEIPIGTGVYTSSLISWDANVPDGTSVTVSASIDDGEYVAQVNGQSISVIPSGMTLTGHRLNLMVQMETADEFVSPTVENLFLKILSEDDAKKIYVVFPSGNQRSFQNALDDITVHYDGAGGLRGEVNPVEPFDWTFTPEGLIQKPDQMETEHVEISSISAAGDLLQIYYHDGYETEHVEIANITAVGVLTDIGDL